MLFQLPFMNTRSQIPFTHSHQSKWATADRKVCDGELVWAYPCTIANVQYHTQCPATIIQESLNISWRRFSIGPFCTVYSSRKTPDGSSTSCGMLAASTFPRDVSLHTSLSLNFSFMLVQLFYGFVTSSLGLLSDSIHMFFDCLALVVGLCAAVMSKWPPTPRFPYGYGKVDTLAGFANGIFLMYVKDVGIPRLATHRR